MKKIACGMGALSHSLLYQTLFMEMGVKVPDGVEYPALPVDTGQSYRCTPSNKTVILCLVLSMLMTMVGADGFVALGASRASDFLPHTLALSFHAMPALSHSLRVRGWLKLSAALALATLFRSAEADPHTLALSSHDIAALSQSDLVKGWAATSSACA